MNGKRAFISESPEIVDRGPTAMALSHMHVQMARELGLNPNKLGKLANHRQQPWKAPLPDFIARCYVKRFGKVPDVVRTIEEVAAAEMAKRQASKLRKLGSPPALHNDRSQPSAHSGSEHEDDADDFGRIQDQTGSPVASPQPWPL